MSMRRYILHAVAYVLGVEVKVAEVSVGRISRRMTD